MLNKVSIANNLSTPSSNIKTAIDTVLFTGSSVTAATVGTFFTGVTAVYAAGRAGYSFGTLLEKNLINGFYGDTVYNLFH